MLHKGSFLHLVSKKVGTEINLTINNRRTWNYFQHGKIKS